MLKRSPGVMWHPHGTLRGPHSTLRCPHSALRCPHGTLRCPGDGGRHWRTSWSSRLMDGNLVGLRRPSGHRASTSHTAHPSCRQLPSPPPGGARRPPGAGASSLGHLPPIFTHPLQAWPGCGLARGGTGSHQCPALGVPASPRQPGAGGEGSPGTAVREERNKADPFSNPHRICRPVRREGGLRTPFWCDFTQKRGRGRPTPQREADGGSVSSSSPPSRRPCEEPPARRDASSAAFEARLGGRMNGALRLLGGGSAGGIYRSHACVWEECQRG